MVAGVNAQIEDFEFWDSVLVDRALEAWVQRAAFGPLCLGLGYCCVQEPSTSRRRGTRARTRNVEQCSTHLFTKHNPKYDLGQRHSHFGIVDSK